MEFLPLFIVIFQHFIFSFFLHSAAPPPQEIIYKSEPKTMNFNLNFKYLFTLYIFRHLFLTISTSIIYIMNNEKTFVETYVLAYLGIMQ